MYGAAAGLLAAALAWTVVRSRPATPPGSGDAALKTWRGGETNACMVALDGARLQAFAGAYNVAMVCGVERDDAEPLTDRAVTVSRAFGIEQTEFAIEEAISGPMRVLLEGRARQVGATHASPLQPADASALPPPHEESLWYEVVLLPKDVNAFDVRTLADLERLGGRRLLTEPRRTVIAIRP